jgi:hypothetical protein
MMSSAANCSGEIVFFTVDALWGFVLQLAHQNSTIAAAVSPLISLEQIEGE